MMKLKRKEDKRKMKITVSSNLGNFRKRIIDLLNKNEKFKKKVIEKKEADDKKKHKYNPNRKYIVKFVEKGK